MDNLRLGKFPNNEGGSCLQDVVIEVNRMSKEQVSLPSKILTNIQPAQLEALKKDKVGLDLTFDVGNTEDKTQIYLDGATQDTAGILTAEDKKVIDSVADLKLGYNEETRMIQLNNGTELVSEIPADRFIKDGMVNGVSIDEETKVVTITFNTDAGKKDIPVDFGDIYDLLLEEAKNYTDNKILILSPGSITGQELYNILISEANIVFIAKMGNTYYPFFKMEKVSDNNYSLHFAYHLVDEDTNTFYVQTYYIYNITPTNTDEIGFGIKTIAILPTDVYINNLEQTLNNKVNISELSNYSTTAQANNLYAAKSLETTVSALSITVDSKANQSTTYTKQEVNDLISSKANSATTLAGYGITDAKIENRTITLGSNSIEIPESPIVLSVSSTANESNAAAYTKLSSNPEIPCYIQTSSFTLRSVIISIENTSSIVLYTIVNEVENNKFHIYYYYLTSNGTLTQGSINTFVGINNLKSTLTYTTEANADNVAVWNNLINGYITTVKIEDPGYTYTLCIDEINGTSLRATSWSQNDTLIKIVYTVNASTGAMTKTQTSYQLTPVTA